MLPVDEDTIARLGQGLGGSSSSCSSGASSNSSGSNISCSSGAGCWPREASLTTPHLQPPTSRTSSHTDSEREDPDATEKSLKDAPEPLLEGAAAVGVTELLAAQNMRRLLEAYKTLAPLTIGGPASTTLEGTPTTMAQGSTAAAAGLVRNLQEPGAVRSIPSAQLWPMAGGAERRDDVSTPPPLSSAPRHPLLSARDRDSSSLLETSLEGRGISCFSVGGELRLCLTQVLQLVFSTIPLQTIHQACEDLQIFCSTSSPGQLALLKLSRVLPVSTTQCGLITKSDAERLCSLLLHTTASSPASNHTVTTTSAAALKSARPEKPATTTTDPFIKEEAAASLDPLTSSLVRVEHNCFGFCRGLIHARPANTKQAQAIECDECHETFSPSRFVCHSHRAHQRGIVHWGFSRDNWTSYIQVWEEYTGEEKAQAQIVLANFKKKFSPSKRKLADNGESAEPWAKRRRDDEEEDDEDVDSRHQPPPLRHPLLPRPPGEVPAAGYGLPASKPPSLQQLPSLIPIKENVGKEKVGVYGSSGCVGGAAAAGGWAPYLQSMAQLQLRILLDTHRRTASHHHQQVLQHQIHLQLQHQHHLHQQQQLHHRQLQLQQRQSSTSSSSSSRQLQHVDGPVLGTRGAAVDTAAAVEAADRRRQPSQHEPVDRRRPAGLQDAGPANTADEFMVGVAAVLAGAGVAEAGRLEVLHVVERLLGRLQQAEQEKVVASVKLKGMEERVSRLERELARRQVVVKEQEDETSTDGGIESGTEADDLSEKLN